MSVVDNILKGLNKYITQLEKAAKDETIQHDVKLANAHQLMTDATKHLDESVRATAIVSNLKNLLVAPTVIVVSEASPEGNTA